MPLNELDMMVLKLVAKYYVLTRQQIQQLSGDANSSGRGTRKRLSRLGAAGYLVKHRVPVALPGMNGAAPVYYPTKKGAEALASYFSDARFLSTNTRHPRADRLSHWIALNTTRMLVEEAADKLPAVQLLSWITEWETINKDDAADSQFTLHTMLRREPPLSCSPDAGFMIEFQGHRKVYYVEQDLATSSPRQIASRKSKGYHQLAAQNVNKKHFPEATVDRFSVLFLTTNEYRAKQTHKEMMNKDGKDLWLMIDQSSVRADNFFDGSIAINPAGEDVPLIKTTGARNISAKDNNSKPPHVADPVAN